MFSISGMVHLRSNALERTILKIWWFKKLFSKGLKVVEGRITFCTLMLWLVLLKIRLARIALAKRRAF
jgi:hypothetical protein